MEKVIMIVLVSKRADTASKVQNVLTQSGCIIKTRLGIHDASPDSCSDCGLIILELIGAKKDQDKLAKNLKSIKGVTIKLERMSCK
jgi:hypothetical protein